MIVEGGEYSAYVQSAISAYVPNMLTRMKFRLGGIKPECIMVCVRKQPLKQCTVKGGELGVASFLVIYFSECHFQTLVALHP